MTVSIIQTVLAALPGTIAAALALFGVWLTNKNTAASSAANRQLQLDVELIKAKQIEFQTKFTLYHQRRADVFETLFEKLSETETVVSRLVNPLQSYEGRTQEEQFDEADKATVELARLFDKKRIYFNLEMCHQMDSILQAFQKAKSKFSVSQQEPRHGRADTELWVEAWKVMQNEIPPIKNALEQQFREVLSGIRPIGAPVVD